MGILTLENTENNSEVIINGNLSVDKFPLKLICVITVSNKCNHALRQMTAWDILGPLLSPASP